MFLEVMNRHRLCLRRRHGTDNNEYVQAILFQAPCCGRQKVRSGLYVLGRRDHIDGQATVEAGGNKGRVLDVGVALSQRQRLRGVSVMAVATSSLREYQGALEDVR